MYRTPLTCSASALAVVLSITACGGGGGSSTGSTQTNDASPRTAQGIITGFGSVFVNGVEYEVDGRTSISVDGSPGHEDALGVGMLVTLTGTRNADGTTGTATSIVYADEMEGPVTATTLSNGAGTLTVLGQTVTVTADTVFESRLPGVTSLDAIAVGNIVEVSGYAAASDGSVIASRIEVKAPDRGSHSGEIEVKGIISGLDTTQKTFQLGALVVSYSDQTVLPSGGPANGQYVEVKVTAAYSGSGPLPAAVVELEDGGSRGRHRGGTGEDFEIRGVVTGAWSAVDGTFEINGQTVHIATTTRFDHGTADSLLAGVPVRVEVVRDAGGDLVATEVELAEGPEVEFEGNVETVDAAAGTITLLGQTIRITGTTILFDRTGDGRRHIGLGEVANAYASVHAHSDSTVGTLVANKLELHTPDDTSKVKGPATVVDSATWSIAGVTVDLSGYSGILPTLLDPATSYVEAKGLYANGTLDALELTLGERGQHGGKHGDNGAGSSDD